jgi:hypothetical protein
MVIVEKVLPKCGAKVGKAFATSIEFQKEVSE